MRLKIEDTAIKLAEAISLRSEDPYKKVGCVILNKDGRILSLGYNGLQSGKNVDLNFWQDRDYRRTFMIHAEANALSCISRYDNPYLLVSTLLPCKNCAINIAAYNIKKLIYKEDYYKDMLALDIFKFYNIEIIKYENN